MSNISKVFGIISYFPDNDTAAHIETRKERSRRFRELLFKLEELWPDIDIIVIAQNWQDFALPATQNSITVYNYPKLGILGARKELRKKFLNSSYDYLIMLDDDGMITCDDPSIYMNEIDKHPDGMGVIRHTDCPLMLLAISKYIYSMVDMPDMDAENDGGFEDDLFVATCFYKYPDKCFDFPADCVRETSFRYEGIGKCPSTWAREKKRDWDYLRNFTDNKIYQIQHPELYTKHISNVNPSIDAVITYVNGSDQTWIKDYITKTKTHNPSAVRYRTWGTLKYLLRGIENYMPFIRDIILIVAYPSQIPCWLNTDKVRVVYHKDFIPKQFLPTFNSCTIESFLWNIPDLADRIIYFNDDMFPINPMAEIDFFTGDIPHIRFKHPEDFNVRNIFQFQSRTALDTITQALNLPVYNKSKILLPFHITQSITRAGLEMVRTKCVDAINTSITALRTVHNINQYIYAYYQYFTDNYINLTVNYKYFEITDKSLPTILNEIHHAGYQMVCLNDSDKVKDYAKSRQILCDGFDKKFPDKSRFEV